MDKKLKLPPLSKDELTPPQLLADKLRGLIGKPFKLTKKSRTDGSNVRKLIASTLIENNHPEPSKKGSFIIIPPKVSSAIQKYTNMQCKSAPLCNTYLAEISNSPASLFCFNL